IIAATNKNLEEKVQNGEFREDLFYRLNVVRIAIPPLRQRREDIPILAAGILRRLRSEMGHRVLGLSPEALQLLCQHDFHGNVRELENILERAVIFANGEEIQTDELDLRGSVAIATGADEEVIQDLGKPASLKELEVEAIVRALHRWEGNRTRAAEELGISRRTLINKIAEYELNL
ncbi:MAG: helix-turn-helix domain-containing protein, partial [Sphaerochaeta sp.]